ncbi:Peptidase C48, SUMO/Sentrin/Ubl1 [Corchorus olitorius]|uniref:Peptidase C48, SUMO/Sentrin/Ubl1 n=1 Tax=Corchorus olitorius TaxID=93759 RepID=A0A1R3L4T4_9ROSI|nr:Peptidase C48, SUMO/Sentrin/Ubl1 [Corchorus olitorius]
MPTPEEVLVFDDSKKLLLDSARALEYGNLELVNAHLERVWTLGAELMEDEEYQGRGRMVKYYAESIVRRAYGLQPSTPYFYSLLPCYYHWAPFDKIEPNVLFPCYSDWAPFHKIEPNDLNLKRKKQVHLIDFYLPHLYDGGFNRPYLFDGLSKVCGESETVCVRLSVVLPPFLKNRVDFRKEEEYLARKAEEENIKLKDFKIVYANNLGEVDDAVLPRRVEEDEALVIFYSNKLHSLEEGQGIAGKAVQSNEPFLFEPDITQLEQPDYPFASAVREFGPHAVVAICLENNYNNDIYVLEFFIPPSEETPMTPDSLARHIFDNLSNMKKRGTKLVIKDSELTLLPGTGSEHQSVGEGNSSFDQDRSRMDAARMFIKLQLPFNMVGHESFSNFVKNLQPMFKVQSQEALSSDILRVYQEEKGNQLDNDIMRSSSACLPDIHDIYKKQSQLEIRDYPLMSVRSDNSWRRTCSLVLAIAAILDPRFKFDLVEFSYSTIYGPDSAGNDLAMIRRTLTNIFNEYASNIYSLNDTNALASLSVAEEKTMETFQKWYNSKMKITTETSELDKYLQEPIICLETEQFEVLGWWSAHASKFPILGRMARDILAIPMSTIIQQGSSLNEKVMMDNPIFKGLDPQIIEAMICGKDWLESPQETSSAVEPVLRENNGQPPAHPLDHLSSESDHKEAPSLPKGSSRPTWSEEDVRTYLMYPLTEKESEYLLKWQSHQISGAQDKILDKALAPLLLIPPSDVHLQNPKQYYIDDRVVNQFFILLKRRYDKFPSKYLKHHSFDSAAAVFLPMCLNQHWLLFCADIDSKNLLWLDSFGYAQLAYANEKAVIRKWFKEVVLPAMDQPKPNDTDWPYIIPTEVPLQKNTVDCGLFVMKYADCLTHGNNDFPFTQDDMPHFRHRTFLDLIHGEIHYKQVQKELTGCEMDVDKSLDSIG